MRHALLFLLTTILAGGLYAQSKKPVTLVGFSTGFVSPIYLSNTSLRNIKIGLPTFSYAASVEKRFSLHQKLNFSFQYSLNYFRPQKPISPESKQISQSSSGNLSTGINLAVFYPINQPTTLSVYSGVGVSQAISSYFSDRMNNSNKMFGPKDFNTSLLLGIENSILLFNRNLYYSLQYNIGFFPYSHSIQTETNKANSPAMFQNVQFGLKYKY